MADDKDPQVQDPSSDSDNYKDCDAIPVHCDLDIQDMDEEGPEATWRDEIEDAFPLTEIKQVLSPTDGLPIPAGERYVPEAAPPFTRNHVVCVEDDREYVELFHDEWNRRRDPRLRVKEIAARHRYNSDGDERLRRLFKPKEVMIKWGHPLVQIEDGSLIPVRPKRERCRFYKRQSYANSNQPDPHEFGHHVVPRNCLARRSIGGAAMSVSNEAVYACDYRDPPDESSVKYFLDDPDKEHLDSGAHKKLVPLFGNN